MKKRRRNENGENVWPYQQSQWKQRKRRRNQYNDGVENIIMKISENETTKKMKIKASKWK